MYNKGDTSYKNQPKVMSKETVDQFLNRVKDHFTKRDINDNPIFSFHGGEPLLAGKDFFKYFVSKANEVLLSVNIQPVFTVQTNGTLIDDEWCKLFHDNNIFVGISIDGEKKNNDENRIYHSGKGSYDDVIKGLNRVLNYKDLGLRTGVLSVINLEADPIETYLHFKRLGIKSFDFLLPDYIYDEIEIIKTESKNISYSSWLIKMFDYWIKDRDQPRIRFFNGMIDAILGGDFANDTLGEMGNELLVIETNGGYEAVDVLKICGEGFTKEGANVFNSSVDEALQTDLANLYHQSHKILNEKCQKCLIQKVCGGGYLPHRYSKKNGFDNPSVYCEDLMCLITHIQNTVLDLIPSNLMKQVEVRKITYEEALDVISVFDPKAINKRLYSFIKEESI
ncbi:hypothetical protein J3359_14380 [Polaribacter cellanae]|uniref:Radical SAM core domain-containing protein n=2 Tax=Polaribacter cellanae TaxID=2818493 RepID=A0A975CQE9_9FLAO|nr:hypothetical protein J3359_14380 [Polaribacter cellanae]